MGGRWYFLTWLPQPPTRAVAMLYQLYCAIIGQKTEFLVDIDETQKVDNLRDAIKAKAETTGPAHTLTLYKADIDISKRDTYKKVMQEIHQNSIKVNREEPMCPADDISEYWEESKPPQKTIHILVELRQGESRGLIDPRVWCVAETSAISSATPKTTFLPLKHTPARPKQDTSEKIEQFLDKYRARMQELVKQASRGESPFSLWKPIAPANEDLAEHILGLGIPKLSSGRPSLLLHDLAEEKDTLDRDRAQRIPKIFSQGHKCVT